MINGCHIGEVLHEDLEYCYITQPPHNVTLNTSVKFEGRDEEVPVKSTAIEITFAQVSLFFIKYYCLLYCIYYTATWPQEFRLSTRMPLGNSGLDMY